MTELISLVSIGVALYITSWYAASIVLQDASIVDIAWGLGFILIAIICNLYAGSNSVVFAISSLCTIWGLRLSWHIYERKKKRPGEDFRYAAWRKNWGKNFWWRSYLQVFALQGFLMVVIALPLIWVTYMEPLNTSLYTVLGALVWLLGFAFEGIADRQLQAFKNGTSKKHILTTGLWKYSRHPNYFGEVVQWWGIWIMALTAVGSFWTIVSPLTITLLIRFVSGVPMLEKKYARDAEFQEYAEKTNVFVPWVL